MKYNKFIELQEACDRLSSKEQFKEAIDLLENGVKDLPKEALQAELSGVKS